MHNGQLFSCDNRLSLNFISLIYLHESAVSGVVMVDALVAQELCLFATVGSVRVWRIVVI